MTDRINALTVVLAEDVRVDDGYLERVTTAIRMIAGVIAVEPHVADSSDVLAEERARVDLGRRVLEAVRAEVYPAQFKGKTK